MKRICFLFLAVLVFALPSAASATAPACPAQGNKACTTPCPTQEGSTPAQCPRTTAAVKPSGCPAQKTAWTAKRPSCGGTPPKVMVKEKDGWKFMVHILQPGSRSQGSHGTLYKDNKQVEGTKGERLETPFGTFVWKGAMEDRVHLWDATGWICEDGNPFQEDAMPGKGTRTSLEELNKQLDGQTGETSK